MKIATMYSLTHAMRARSILLARGISSEVVTLDPSLTRRGCGYGIRFSDRDADRTLAILAEKQLDYGTILGGGR